MPPPHSATPAGFHLMAKPRGPICNLDCHYCYYLSKTDLYPGSRFQMADDVLEAYTRDYIAAQQVPEVTFTWQGGEPTLMGLDFFRRAIDYQQKYTRPGLKINNALQTNGILLDGDWCHFLKDHNFLVGLSIDGPRELHDRYRLDRTGRPTFDQVIAALRLLQKHGIAYNILTTVHAANASHPLEVYRFLRDQAGAHHLQFIPIVEPDDSAGRSVGSRQYGEFMIAIFDEWVRHDVGRVFVQLFDVALSVWLGQPPGLCIFAETCGAALALEHNGDLYACDHFVEPAYHLGNLLDQPLSEMIALPMQQQFGQAKCDALPGYCRACEVRFICNGGCPRNRFTHTPGGEPGLNYLCQGYRTFFNHIAHPMRLMADLLRAGHPPAAIMGHLLQEQAQLTAQFARTGRNQPCPCGSGRKYKHCHGRAG